MSADFDYVDWLVGSSAKKNEHAYVKAMRLDPCAYCAQPSKHIDHIVPRSRRGGDGSLNLTPACQSCSSSKGTRSLLAFLGRKRAKAEAESWAAVA